MSIQKIVVIILIVAAIGIVMVLVVKLDTYSDFSKAAADTLKSHQIIGSLVKEKKIGTDSLNGQAYFSFYMFDDKNQEMKVLYMGARPQDFEKLSEIVVTGKVSNGVFYASKMLLKCPSKYDGNNLPEEYKETEF